jgi:hypothetical protein
MLVSCHRGTLICPLNTINNGNPVPARKTADWLTPVFKIGRGEEQQDSTHLLRTECAMKHARDFPKKRLYTSMRSSRRLCNFPGQVQKIRPSCRRHRTAQQPHLFRKRGDSGTQYRRWLLLTPSHSALAPDDIARYCGIYPDNRCSRPPVLVLPGTEYKGSFLIGIATTKDPVLQDGDQVLTGETKDILN